MKLGEEMLNHFFVVAIAISAVGFLYGVYNINLEVESNACQMTYMFAPPQFSRVHSTDDVKFPDYGLYYYNEGRIPIDVGKKKLNGAPVIFIPGNGGSYKQVRSLASVALRKAREVESGVHLDYYTIDFSEELSALYGHYLERQTLYLKNCIETILKLYANDKKIALIGHSMGAVISQAILRDPEISKHVNTLISLSSPINKPILILDEKIEMFYKSINKSLSRTRSSFKPDENFNVCSSSRTRFLLGNYTNYYKSYLKNVMIISIGGGNRDLLVQPGYTFSKFSDIHSMTMSIPKVWISCDHLSAVWCLQLVLVINRYLFEISKIDKNKIVYFINDRAIREKIAHNYFVKPNILAPKEINVEQQAMWREDKRRVFSKGFKEGVKNNFIQMIPLRKHLTHQKLCIDINRLDLSDFIFGCSVKHNVDENLHCKTKVSLSHNFYTLPWINNEIRTVAILDIKNLRNTFPNWTHIGIFLRASRKPKSFNIDIHNPTERQVYFKLPHWSTLQKTTLVKETSQGTVYYKLLIQGLEETYSTMELKFEPLSCLGDSNPVVIKMCTPWLPGFTKYHIIRDPSAEVFYVNIPVASPRGYNLTKNPISLEVYLDPACRYHISYKFSIEGTMSRIVHHFYQWLPSHLTAVILIILKNKISKLHHESSTKGIRPFHGYFQFSSIYLITGCRIFSKLVIKNENHDDLRGLSIYLVAIIHSTAIVISIVTVFAVWILIIFNAYGFSKVINWCLFRSVLLPVAGTFPLLFGAFIISLALKTCGELALVVTCILYLLLISNAYSDYVENWILNTAVTLHTKLRSFYYNQSFKETAETSKNVNSISCNGMNNFSFHISLFILLLIITALNSMSGVAWIKDHSIVMRGGDPSLFPSLIVILSLSVLWLLKAPQKIPSFQFGYKAVSILLYISASGCIILCQEALYKLNYIISATFVIIVLQEILGRGWTTYNKIKNM
ncbi:GPI inositol-deacylase [Ceratitis capitata]|uniref:GPI inositol-deacylase n=1 Tax=Ceratitis capitata TaxID=7213 RepID=W8BQ10_CERCA|nr:GPI inositol-deacylase [Ceratitis capitata]